MVFHSRHEACIILTVPFPGNINALKQDVRHCSDHNLKCCYILCRLDYDEVSLSISLSISLSQSLYLSLSLSLSLYLSLSISQSLSLSILQVIIKKNNACLNTFVCIMINHVMLYIKQMLADYTGSLSSHLFGKRLFVY